MRSYEQIRNKMLERIEEYNAILPTGENGIYTSQEQADKKTILEDLKKDTEELLELIVFSLLKDKDTFFGNVIIQLHRNIDYNISAPAAVSFHTTYFNLNINPILFAPYTLREMKAVLIHELYHMICKHLPRTLPLFRLYPATILNLGTDCAINQYINGLPDGCVTLQSLKNHWKVKRPLEEKRESEYYIKNLLEEYKENEEFKQKIDGEQQGQGQGNGKGQGQGGDGEGDGQGQGGGQGQQSMPGVQDKENYRDAHNTWQKSDTGQSMESAADDVVRSVLNNAAAKSRGRIPGMIQEVMKKLNEKPIIPWQDVLKKFIGTLAKPYKKTPTRLDRRQPKRMELRGRLNDHVCEVVVAIDTSGSMDDRTLTYCMNEIFEIVDTQKSKVTIVECDTKIGKVYEAKKIEDVQLNLSGRGGTSFSPVFEWINENNKRNVVLVYFTDGWGESKLSVRPINKHTLWVLTGRREELSVHDYPGEVKELRLDEKWNKMNR